MSLEGKSVTFSIHSVMYLGVIVKVLPSRSVVIEFHTGESLQTVTASPEALLPTLDHESLLGISKGLLQELRSLDQKLEQSA